MKKILLVAAGLLVFSCSKKVEATDSSKESSTLIEEPKQEEAKLTPLEEGKSLVEGADCLGCHKMDEKMIGPSYKEVSEKYENTPENVEMLAEKIIKGSSGIWGDVPMPAHNGMSKENAKYMAQYILSSK